MAKTPTETYLPEPTPQGIGNEALRFYLDQQFDRIAVAVQELRDEIESIKQQLP